MRKENTCKREQWQADADNKIIYRRNKFGAIAADSSAQCSFDVRDGDK